MPACLEIEVSVPVMEFNELVKENELNEYKIQNLKKIHAVLTDSCFISYECIIYVRSSR